ncbi:MAG TPA: hypothetical protein VFB06_09665 [Streptosporangiaceae bacterium]|nr:hypothetical protein [Streptosporangiaceae bacterium]
MTRTEERLRDYFSATADSVRADNTAPLAPPRPAKRQRRGYRHRGLSGNRGWHAWGAPLVAGVSVLAVVALAVTLAGLTAGHRSTMAPASGATTGQPQYYAEIDGSDTGGSVVILSTSSGAVIANVDKSTLLENAALPAQPIGMLSAVAAAPDDRTFYAEMFVAHNQAWIFKFSVSGAGSVTGITRIPGGIVQGAYSSGVPRLVVSPDGERLALTTTSPTALSAILSGKGHIDAVQDEIVVIDLRAGTQRTWADGLYATDSFFTIQSLSWNDSGRSLLFVPGWYSVTGGSPYRPFFIGNNGSSQVRLLDISSGSGTSLADSKVLLSAQDPMQQVVSDQDGNLDVLKVSGPGASQAQPVTVTVEQFSATTGAPERVLYQHAYRGTRYSDHLVGVYLEADPSGSYLLFGLEFNVSTVANEVWWLDQGSLRPLTVGKDDAVILPDAW